MKKILQFYLWVLSQLRLCEIMGSASYSISEKVTYKLSCPGQLKILLFLFHFHTYFHFFCIPQFVGQKYQVNRRKTSCLAAFLVSSWISKDPVVQPFVFIVFRSSFQLVFKRSDLSYYHFYPSYFVFLTDDAA